MPPSKPKPSEIAVEAKKSYIPYIRNTLGHAYPSNSYLCDTDLMVARLDNPGHVCRFAFYDQDPVDLALQWAVGGAPVPVIMPANEKRAGGDWEAGVMQPEECLCRRSNLYATLTTSNDNGKIRNNYPIPTRAGIYSEHVVVFRNGPPDYDPWEAPYRALPIISVCPVKRPKLDSSGKKYSFSQERELMRSKIVATLRIAVHFGHENLCIGTFGLGPGFRNPAEEVALLWRDALLFDQEFQGRFRDIVFAFEACEGQDVAGSPGPSSKNSSSTKSSSKSSSSKSSSSKSSSSKSSSSKSTAPKGPLSSTGVAGSTALELDVFRHVFKPAVIHDTYH